MKNVSLLCLNLVAFHEMGDEIFGKPLPVILSFFPGDQHALSVYKGGFSSTISVWSPVINLVIRSILMPTESDVSRVTAPVKPVLAFLRQTVFSKHTHTYLLISYYL